MPNELNIMYVGHVIVLISSKKKNAKTGKYKNDKSVCNGIDCENEQNKTK